MSTEEDGGRHARRVIEIAMGWVGTPYRHQGSRRQVGCDCLGLVRGVWRELYGTEAESPGPYSRDWAETSGQERLLDAAGRYFEKCEQRIHAGRLLVFRWRHGLPAKHVGIAVDHQRFIHAYEGHAVTVSPLGPHWRQRIARIFAFPQADAAVAPKDRG